MLYEVITVKGAQFGIEDAQVGTLRGNPKSRIRILFQRGVAYRAPEGDFHGGIRLLPREIRFETGRGARATGNPVSRRGADRIVPVHCGRCERWDGLDGRLLRGSVYINPQPSSTATPRRPGYGRRPSGHQVIVTVSVSA